MSAADWGMAEEAAEAFCHLEYDWADVIAASFLNDRLNQPAPGKRPGRKPHPAPDQGALARVREEMKRSGITVSDWARANNFSRYTVTEVLLGRLPGHSGESHRVCVALGLKTGQVVHSAKGWKPGTPSAGA